MASEEAPQSMLLKIVTSTATTISLHFRGSIGYQMPGEQHLDRFR